MSGHLRSMRARMTALFALFVAGLMLIGGAAVQNREARRADKLSRESLSFAFERAHVEIEETKANPKTSHKTLLQIVTSNRSELAAGGLVLVVVAEKNPAPEVLWRSRQHAPQWPDFGDDWRVRSLSQGGQTLVLAQDWELIEEDLAETARALWQLGALVVGATALGAWFVVGRTLSPLDRLAAQAQAQAQGASIEGLQVRLESPSSDAEMRHLTQTLNDLLARLEKEAQARGRFYAAASHELRTPIQVLLGQIDVARSRARPVASHEEILAQLQSETERLAALVQDLLQLNALEMRQNMAPRERLNLKFWVERALSQQAESIDGRELMLDAHLGDAEIEATPAHIEILLRNLLENAVKYAAPSSSLQVGLESDGQSARFEVWNRCDLPADADLTTWFEPFFRPDASRNSQTGGNGLGLSIVAALALANGWKVELQAHQNGVLAQVWFDIATVSSLEKP